MKIFVYNYREEDEKNFFADYCNELDVECIFYSGYPSLENVHLAKGCDAISIIVCDMNAAMLEKFHEIGIKYISTRSIGYDHIDLQKAKELGMNVCNVTYPENSVANYTIMMILMACRKIKHIIDRNIVQDFSLDGKMGKEISKCTVGIIGTGKIGKSVIKKLSVFGCKILANSEYVDSEVQEYATYVDLETLIKNSDIISLHAPLNEDTYHIIDEEKINKMKDEVIIVNTARGGLIDTNALINGIESEKIGSVALDVIEDEHGLYYHNFTSKILKYRALSILKSFPNVVITPHTAYYTDEAVMNMVRNSIKACYLCHHGMKNEFKIV